jgi:hypothetical protein
VPRRPGAPVKRSVGRSRLAPQKRQIICDLILSHETDMVSRNLEPIQVGLEQYGFLSPGRCITRPILTTGFAGSHFDWTLTSGVVLTSHSVIDWTMPSHGAIDWRFVCQSVLQIRHGDVIKQEGREGEKSNETGCFWRFLIPVALMTTTRVITTMNTSQEAKA